MTIPLALRLLAGSSCQPGHLGAKLPCGDFTSRATSLFGVAPGGACLASPVASPAVGSYPTVSPLPSLVRRTDAYASFARETGRSLLCGAFPRVTPAGRYPAPLLHGVRTFLVRSGIYQGRPMRTRDHPAIRAAPSYAQAAHRSMGRVGRCVGKHAPQRGGAAPARCGLPRDIYERLKG